MLQILKHRTYRHLFLAQVVALIGTGLATVALSLLAFDLAGNKAGQILGTAMAIKMTAYVLIAPLASALAERVPRRMLLVSLDLVRAVTALALPFVSEVWEVYVLIAILQSASAAFTPTFQSTIPDTLANENCTHVLCNAHHKCELTRAYEHDGQQWAWKMETMLDQINEAVKDAGGCLPMQESKKWRRKYRLLLKKAETECPAHG